MKYQKTMMESAKDKISDIGDGMEMAYDIKRDEITKNLPDNLTSKLSDAEIRRAQKAGVVLGVFVIVVLLGLILYFAVMLLQGASG